MEGISSSTEAGPAIVTKKLQWDTLSWTSWWVLKGLLREEMSASERSNLLEAFGSCQSVRSISTLHLWQCLESVLEWETLLRRLKSNPDLEEIVINLDPEDMNTWSKLGGYWREVFKNSSSLKRLGVYIPGRDGSYEHPEYGLLCSLFVEELVQGLRSNCKSPLEELVMKLNSSSFSVVHIADMVHCSSRLHKFVWDGFKHLGGTEIQALSDALRQSSSLRTFEIIKGTESMSEVLLEVFTGVGSSRSVNSLHLCEGLLQGFASVLPRLMKASIPHIIVQCRFSGNDGQSDSRMYGWRETGRALLEATGVHTLSLEVRLPNFGTSKVLNRIDWAEKILKTSERSPKLSFSLDISFHLSDWGESRTLSLFGLARLREIHLKMVGAETSSFLEKAMHFISKNEDVETCSLGCERSSLLVARDNRELVLEKIFLNSSIKELTLRRSFFFGRLVTEEFKQLLLLLQRNSTLQKLDVQYDDWVLDGKVALLEKALNRNVNRNGRHAQFISTVRQAGLHFSPLKAGRILICGSPYAGKTKLRRSMIEVATRGKIHWWTGQVKRRTKGIEISTLRDDNDMNLTLWDLGGQWIFRSLQDLLFPKAGQACIFLFVFNPVEMVDGRQSKKVDLPSAFRKELMSWLRFIASNYPVATDLPPQVMVVLSHKDKMQECERDLGWAREIVLQLRTCFEGKVDVSLRERELHFIDSFNAKDVSRVIESITRRAESIFDKLVERQLVPSPPVRLTSLLTGRPDRIRKNPVWSSSDLYQYFRSQNIGLQNLDPQTETGCQILRSLALYLHDVGVIIRIPDSDLIVVDPGWLTGKFLGELINYGHDFQPGRIIQQLGGRRSRDGFIDAQLLHSILRNLVKTYHREDVHVPLEVLRELLFKLDLCFEVDGDHTGGSRRYFMPSLCGSGEKFPITKLQWSSISHGSSKDFGFRLQCYDRERTCFTRSFFPTFQVRLRNELVQKRIADVRCSQGLMEVRGDGHEIFIESDELGEDHIDIMVRSSPHRSKEEAEEFVQENVIDFLRSFCASEMGCMGVLLSEHILRTQCVTQLIPRDYRGDDQVISVVELKNKVEADARKRLKAWDRKEVKLHTWLESCVEVGLRYGHWWPEISSPDPQTCLQREAEVAEDLLPIKIQKSIRRQLETIAHDLEQCMYLRPPRTRQEEIFQLNDEVYEISAPVNSVPQLELIFIHGIHEESEEKPYFTTWSTRDSKEELWLNTWLVSQAEVDLSQARILTVTYDSSMKKTTEEGNMGIFQVAENLTYSLIVLAGVGQNNCPVLVVGHSLGGLLMKEVCIQASHVQSLPTHSVMYQNFLQHVKGFFFYSTPHLGLELTQENSSHTTGFQWGELMKSLEFCNAPGAQRNSEFDSLCRKYEWKACGVVESISVKIHLTKDDESTTVEILVREASARAGCPHGLWTISDSNHFTICKPESLTSNNFLHLVRFIKDII